MGWCQMIAQAIDGELEVQTELGEGTECKLMINLDKRGEEEMTLEGTI